MNTNSYLCRFMQEHPSDWEARLEEMCVGVKREGSYALMQYGLGCDFSQPVVQEARGIIIDTETLEVLAWPFRKFGNFNERYADEIDWSTARVQEKVDGSIIKLWFDPARDAWRFSTSGNICADEAPVGGDLHLTFGHLIRQAENYGQIPFDSLDHDKTYIFELVSPATRVIIQYGAVRLYHIGTRHNRTGVESEEDIGVIKPRTYPLGSLEECIAAARALNRNVTEEAVTGEGYVVVDAAWHRVKVKSPDYIMVHGFLTGNRLTKLTCITLLQTDPDMVGRIMANDPATVPMFKFYEYQLAYLFWLADEIGEFAVKLRREYDGDLAPVAAVISKHRLSDIGFRCARSGARGRDILAAYPPERIARFIPEYTPENLGDLF